MMQSPHKPSTHHTNPSLPTLYTSVALKAFVWCLASTSLVFLSVYVVKVNGETNWNGSFVYDASIGTTLVILFIRLCLSIRRSWFVKANILKLSSSLTRYAAFVLSANKHSVLVCEEYPTEDLKHSVQALSEQPLCSCGDEGSCTGSCHDPNLYPRIPCAYTMGTQSATQLQQVASHPIEQAESCSEETSSVTLCISGSKDVTGSPHSVASSRLSSFWSWRKRSASERKIDQNRLLSLVSQDLQAVQPSEPVPGDSSHHQAATEPKAETEVQLGGLQTSSGSKGRVLKNCMPYFVNFQASDDPALLPVVLGVSSAEVATLEGSGAHSVTAASALDVQSSEDKYSSITSEAVHVVYAWLQAHMLKNNTQIRHSNEAEKPEPQNSLLEDAMATIDSFQSVRSSIVQGWYLGSVTLLFLASLTMPFILAVRVSSSVYAALTTALLVYILALLHELANFQDISVHLMVTGRATGSACGTHAAFNRRLVATATASLQELPGDTPPGLPRKLCAFRVRRRMLGSVAPSVEKSTELPDFSMYSNSLTSHSPNMSWRHERSDGPEGSYTNRTSISKLTQTASPPGSRGTIGLEGIHEEASSEESIAQEDSSTDSSSSGVSSPCRTRPAVDVDREDDSSNQDHKSPTTPSYHPPTPPPLKATTSVSNLLEISGEEASEEAPLSAPQESIASNKSNLDPVDAAENENEPSSPEKPQSEDPAPQDAELRKLSSAESCIGNDLSVLSSHGPQSTAQFHRESMDGSLRNLSTSGASSPSSSASLDPSTGLPATPTALSTHNCCSTGEKHHGTAHDSSSHQHPDEDSENCGPGAVFSDNTSSTASAPIETSASPSQSQEKVPSSRPVAIPVRSVASSSSGLHSSTAPHGSSPPHLESPLISALTSCGLHSSSDSNPEQSSTEPDATSQSTEFPVPDLRPPRYKPLPRRSGSPGQSPSREDSVGSLSKLWGKVGKPTPPDGAETAAKEATGDSDGPEDDHNQPNREVQSNGGAPEPSEASFQHSLLYSEFLKPTNAHSAIAAPASGPGPSTIITRIERAISSPAHIQFEGSSSRQRSDDALAIAPPIHGPAHRVHPDVLQSISSPASQRSQLQQVPMIDLKRTSAPPRPPPAENHTGTVNIPPVDSGATTAPSVVPRKDRSLVQALRNAASVSYGVVSPPPRLVKFVRPMPARVRRLQEMQRRNRLRTQQLTPQSSESVKSGRNRVMPSAEPPCSSTTSQSAVPARSSTPAAQAPSSASSEAQQSPLMHVHEGIDDYDPRFRW